MVGSRLQVTVVKSSVEALDALGPLETIWHTATVYKDALFPNLTEEQWDAVVAVKVPRRETLENMVKTTSNAFKPVKDPIQHSENSKLLR